MSVTLSPEQQEYYKMFYDFCEKELKPIVPEYDIKGEFPKHVFDKVAEMGATLVTVPEEFGGLGESHLTQAAIWEAIGYFDAGFAVSTGANELGTIPIFLSKNDEMKKLAGSMLADGKMAAFCLTEPDAGSDAANTKTTIRKEGNEYVINGSKCFITNGGVADLYSVFCTFDPAQGAKAMAGIVIEADRPGVTRGKDEDKMGIRLSNTCSVFFDEVRVPEDHLIAEQGKGIQLALGTLDCTRGAGSAAAVGLMQRAIDEAVVYAKTRVTMGKPIIKHQMVQALLADMEIKTQAARTMVYQCAAMLDEGTIDPIYSACTKTFVGDAAVEVALNGVQVLGGYGYSREYPMEKLVRDAKIYQIFEGTNQIQRMTIAGGLARRYKD